MCGNDPFEEAYRNVAHSADSTWIVDLSLYQRANMDLHIKDCQVKRKITEWGRVYPRCVRDCIPSSRLARYGNYEYDESREMSYSSVGAITFERLGETFGDDAEKEPWMLDEIDDLYIAFVNYRDYPWEACNCQQNNEKSPHYKDSCEICYESPLLEARSFEEMALKMKTVSRPIKKIWDCKYYPWGQWPVAGDSNLELFRSFSSQIVSLTNEESCDDAFSTRPRHELQSDLTILSQTLKKRNSWLIKKQYLPSPTFFSSSVSDSPTNRRLYSAVLQGTNDGKIASLEFSSTEHAKASVIRYPSISTSTSSLEASQSSKNITESNPLSRSQNSFLRFSNRSTTLANQATAYPNPSYPYYPHYLNPRLLPNNIFANASTFNVRQGHYLPLVLPNPHYAQSHFLGYQRAVFSTYGRTVTFAPRPVQVPQVVIPTSGWFLQQVPKPNITVYQNRPPIQQPAACFRCPNSVKNSNVRPNNNNNNAAPQPCTREEIEEVVAKTVNAVLEDSDSYVPISGTSSDELEIQALEQYSSSDVFQDLERQAAEQYENGSENWKSPPKSHNAVSFGGCCYVGLIVIV